MFSATSLEAQKLISVSITKMNASRITRTGASLHRSLLVATVLHKARNIYFEEERERAARFPCPPPEVTVTPVCHLNNPHLNVNTLNNTTTTSKDKDTADSSKCEDDVATPEGVSEQSKLPLAEANTDNNITHTTNTTTTVTCVTNSSTVTTSSCSSGSRKRRRVSDQETAAAVSSILPKRLRSELKDTSDSDNSSDEENSTKEFYSESSISSDRVNYSYTEDSHVENKSTDVDSRLNDSVAQDEPTSPDGKSSSGSSSEDSDSDEDSSSDTSTSSVEEMEVDKLTSLVSYFSFSQSQKKSEYRLSPIHSNGPHIVALTA